MEKDNKICKYLFIWKKILLTVLVLMSVGVCSGCSNDTIHFLESEMLMEEETDNQIENQTENYTEGKAGEIVQLTPNLVQADLEEGHDEKSEEDSKLFVHVCGAVVNPGVYEVRIGSRVFQVIEMAGGVLKEAAAEYVNQAMEVTDGQQIYIPTLNEIEQEQTEWGAMEFSSGEEFSTGEININTADKTDLMTISGIGESRAQDIINYREQHGGFSAIEEIMNVPGIKEATFEKIKDSIKVK